MLIQKEKTQMEREKDIYLPPSYPPPRVVHIETSSIVHELELLHIPVKVCLIML